MGNRSYFIPTLKDNIYCDLCGPQSMYNSIKNNNVINVCKICKSNCCIYHCHLCEFCVNYMCRNCLNSTKCYQCSKCMCKWCTEITNVYVENSFTRIYTDLSFCKVCDGTKTCDSCNNIVKMCDNDVIICCDICDRYLCSNCVDTSSKTVKCKQC